MLSKKAKDDVQTENVVRLHAILNKLHVCIKQTKSVIN